MLGGWRFSWLFVVVAGTVVAFLGRVVLVALARHRKPALAAAAERWWSWVPLAIVAGVGSGRRIGALRARDTSLAICWPLARGHPSDFDGVGTSLSPGGAMLGSGMA